MKVPIYKSQTQRTGAMPLQLSQLRTTADMFGGQVANQISKVSGSIAEWGLKKAELQAESEALEAKKNLIATLAETSNDLLQNNDPIASSNFAASLFEEHKFSFTNSLTTKRAKQLYDREAGIVIANKLVSFNKENNKRIIEKSVSDLGVEVNDAQKDIQDPKLSVQEKIQSLGSTLKKIDASIISLKQKETLKSELILNSTIGLVGGTITASENPVATALDIINNKDSNPLIKELFARLGPKEVEKIKEDALDLGFKIQRANTEQEEKREAVIDEEITKLKQTGINTTSLEVAQDAYEKLLEMKAFTNVSERRKYEEHLGVLRDPRFAKTEPPLKVEDQIETIETIKDLLVQGTLDTEYLKTAFSQGLLSKDTYMKYLGEFGRERKEGEKEGIKVINDSFQFGQEYQNTMEPQQIKNTVNRAQTIFKKWVQANSDATEFDIINEAEEIVVRVKNEYASGKGLQDLIANVKLKAVAFKKSTFMPVYEDIVDQVSEKKIDDALGILTGFMKTEEFEQLEDTLIIGALNGLLEDLQNFQGILNR